MRRLPFSMILLLSLGLAWAQDVLPGTPTLTIDKTGVVYRVAIPDFTPQGQASPALAQELREILADDLTFSAVLESLETRQFIEETHAADLQSGKINFPEWQRLQADFLIKGTCDVQGADLFIEAILYDCVTGTDIVGRRYKGVMKLKRNMIHRFSDEVVQYLTGNPGCAATRIAFVSDVTGNRELYIMDYDGANLTQLTKNKSLVVAPAWSSDGQTLALTTYHVANYPALFQIKADGTGLRMIATAGSLNVASAWHPKLPCIALTLNPQGNADIYIVDLRTNARKRLTDAPGVDISPSWSPDGQQIAFCSDRSGKPQIYVMGAEGGSARRVTTEGGYNSAPDWSPVSADRGGDWLAYCCLRGRFDIGIIRPDASDQRYLTDGQGNNEDPSWSPDGRHVAFTSTRSGRRALYCVTLRSGKITSLPCGSGEVTTPAWSPRVTR